MARNDIRIRRNVFRTGKISSKRDFRRFESEFNTRKRREQKIRNILLMVAILLLAIILLFTLRALSHIPPEGHPELNVEVVNQIL